MCAWFSFGKIQQPENQLRRSSTPCPFWGRRRARRRHIRSTRYLYYLGGTIRLCPTCGYGFLFVGDANMAHRVPAVLALLCMGFSLDTSVPPLPPTRPPTHAAVVPGSRFPSSVGFTILKLFTTINSNVHLHPTCSLTRGGVWAVHFRANSIRVPTNGNIFPFAQSWPKARRPGDEFSNTNRGTDP